MAGVGVLAAWFVACAGETIPTIDDDLRQDVEDVYGDEGGGGQQGNAGSAAVPGGGAAGAAGAGGNEPSGGAGAGGAGGGEPVGGGGGGGGGDVCDAYNTIIVPSCGLAGCHNEGSSQGAFAVDGEEAGITAFVDRASTFDTCDLVFIDSNDPTQSLLQRRTEEDTIEGCGLVGRMPLGDQLSAADQACLNEWLTQFAN
jgi:hypothetical protein